MRVAVAVTAAAVLLGDPAISQTFGDSNFHVEPVSHRGWSGSAGVGQELGALRREARRAGCNRGFLFRFSRRGEACGALMGRIRRLERQMSRGWGGRRNGNREMAAARGYRTICVRLCDGYYFQLNFAASRKRIADDARKCESHYGPGEALLFYYRNRGDPSEAISVKGERYADQPYAFAFRSAYKPNCAAELHRGLAALGQRTLAALVPTEETAGGAVIAIPTPRPSRSTDPETLANRQGGFVPSPLETDELAAAAPRIVGEPEQPVSVTPGQPPRIPGYKLPEMRDFRELLKADILPAPRS